MSVSIMAASIKHRYRLLCLLRPLLLTALLTCFSIAPTTTFANLKTPLNLETRVTTLIDQQMPHADIGVVVIDANTGQLLLNHNGYQAFTPASNEKLLTSAAALFYLGKHYHYETRLLINPKQLNNNLLSGNLVMQWQGDPSFTSADLDAMLEELHNKGVNTINGTIIFDGTRFTKPVYAPGWNQDDTHWRFSAPITAVMLNQNASYLHITPGNTLGAPAQLTLPKSLPFLELTSHVQTVTYQNSLHSCSLLLDMNQNNQITADGCWPIGKTTTLGIALKNPEQFAMQVMRQSLKKNHILFTGNIQLGKTPENFTPLVTHPSQELTVLLATLLKHSNNIYAESILKTLGAVRNHTGSFQVGINAVKAILAPKTGINFTTDTNLFDGSGASNYDLVTPMAIVRLLDVIYHTPSLSSLFSTLLPNAGLDGTLAHRMQSAELKGRIQAKTGSMKGVSALSGYMTTQSNRRLIFSIFVNHMIASQKDAHRLQSDIASTLYHL